MNIFRSLEVSPFSNLQGWGEQYNLDAGKFISNLPHRLGYIRRLPGGSIPVRVSEHEDYYLIEAALPGWATKEQVEISLMEDATLAIKINNPRPEKSDEVKYLVEEFVPQNSTRFVHLPNNISAEHISANCDGNLLKINVPKSSAKKDIAIKVE